MKHIIIFEKLIDGKIKLQNKIYNILQIIGHEVSINDIIKCKWKNNKVYAVFNNKNYKRVQVKICTFTNKNSITSELISVLNIPQMIQLFEYLKNNFPEEYKKSLIVDDIEKYNL